MFGYLIRRILQSIVVLLCVSFVVFVILYMSGDPVEMLLPPEATQIEIDELRHHMGLDQPFHVQYATFMKNALRAIWVSPLSFNKPAIGLIIERTPATLELALFAMILAVVIGIPAGMYAAIRPDTRLSKSIMSASLWASACRYSGWASSWCWSFRCFWTGCPVPAAGKPWFSWASAWGFSPWTASGT
jgi:peptide/nickel transport system permease protein